VVWHRADLLDAPAAAEVVAQVRAELLLHLAWDVTPGAFWTAPGNVRWVEASLALLRAFLDGGGARAVLAGTCAEYDWAALQGPCRELGTPLGPHTLYGTCKHATRLVAQALAAQRGASLAWGRIFHLYGPGEQAGRLVPSVARALLAGEPVRTSDGSQIRDFAHVRDVAAGFAALLDSDAQGPVNIATGRPVSVRAVIEAIAAATGNGELIEWGALDRVPGEPPELFADVTRMREEVGFTAGTDLAEGLRETVESWRRGG
jgi:nucleoside-diphosphate-sugar epimerase